MYYTGRLMLIDTIIDQCLDSGFTHRQKVKHRSREWNNMNRSTAQLMRQHCYFDLVGGCGSSVVLMILFRHALVKYDDRLTPRRV